jgi:hypothetical protein
MADDVSAAKHNLNHARQSRDQLAHDFWQQAVQAGKEATTLGRQDEREVTTKREDTEKEP